MDPVGRWMSRLPVWARWVSGVVLIPIIYVATTVIDGFIGNRGDAIIVAAVELAGGWGILWPLAWLILGLVVGVLTGRFFRRGTDRVLEAS